jgi:hypothetical protein
VPLEVDVDGLLSHWRWFGEWSLGCIGVLSDWLVETVDDLCKRAETTLTIEALERHALQPDQRARMEIEARTGERKVELGKTKGEEELKRLLGNPAPLPGTTPPDHSVNGTSDVSASPNTTRNTGSKKRIERAATRDFVGDQLETAKTLKCPFAGRVEIEAKRFLESGIKLVECPNCASTRSLSPRNGALRFPSHDKRKTRTPNTDQQWARCETVWGVVGGEQVTPILATKLYLPRLRANVVNRHRLLDRLNEGLHCKLTLISAPAGFGKTTLVSEWLAGCGRPAAVRRAEELDLF